MSQSSYKENSLLPSFVAKRRIIFSYLLIAGWFLFISAGIFKIIPSPDFGAGYYVPGQVLTDWHSPLLWGQLRLLDYLIPGNYDVELASYIMTLFWLLTLAAGVVFIIRKLISKGRVSCYFLLSVISVVNPLCFDSFMATKDLALACLVCIFLSLCYTWDNSHSVFRFCVLLLLLLFAVSHRSNAVILLPVLVFYATYTFAANKWSVRIRCVFSLVITLLCGVTIYGINYHIFDARRAHAENVMLQSDIYCMDVLEGHLPMESMLSHIDFDVDTRWNKCDAVFPLNAWSLCPIVAKEPQNEERVNRICKEVWRQRVIESPITFLVVRTVLTTRFFLPCNTPEFLKQCVNSWYPNQSYNLEYDSIPAPIVAMEIAQTLGVPVEVALIPRYLYTAIYFLSVILPPFFFWRWRRAWANSSEYRLALIAYLSSLIYTLSFMPFVPTSDSRFLSPSFTFMAFSIGMMLTFRKTSEKRSLR